MKLIRDIRIGVSNLIKWFPIIWKDKDWDQTFFFRMIQFKLKNMEKYFRHGNFIGTEKQADKIDMCVSLLNRIIEEKYHDLAYVTYDKKWGASDFLIKEDGFLEIKYENVETTDDEIERSKDFKNCSSKEEYLIEQDLEFLFKIIRNNVRFWWD